MGLSNREVADNFWSDRLNKKYPKISPKAICDSMKYGDTKTLPHKQAASMRDYMGKTAFCRGMVRRVDYELSQITKLENERTATNTSGVKGSEEPTQ